MTSTRPGQRAAQPAIAFTTLSGLLSVQSGLELGGQGLVDRDGNRLVVPFDARAVTPIFDDVGKGRRGRSQVPPVIAHQDPSAGRVVPILDEQEIGATGSHESDAANDPMLAVGSTPLAQMTHEYDSDVETLSHRLEGRKHPSQFGVAVVVGPREVGGYRVNDDHLAVADPRNGGLDGVKVVRQQGGKVARSAGRIDLDFRDHLSAG